MSAAETLPLAAANDGGVLLTYSQAAELINVPLGTLYCWVHDRRIPFVRLGPRLVRFPRIELLQWLDAHRVQPRGKEGGTP